MLRRNKKLMPAPQQTEKETMLNAFEEAYQKLMLAATLATQRSTKVSTQQWNVREQWGIREILAHIAGWAAWTTAQIPHIINGVPEIVYIDDNQHSIMDNVANAAFLALIEGQSLDQIRSITEKTHQRYIAVLQAQDESVFLPHGLLHNRLQRVIDHHLEHVAELEQL